MVLLAGLFRALVIRATGAALAGRAPPAVRPELLEAATWRAAQSGLEGNLVDPVTATPVPAHQLIRQLLADLRPALESTRDWELAAELTKSALAGGSSAARQRTASARGGLAKVVDTLLAEARANTDWLPGAESARTTVARCRRATQPRRRSGPVRRQRLRAVRNDPARAGQDRCCRPVRAAHPP